jgi:hypothetical protein
VAGTIDLGIDGAEDEGELMELYKHRIIISHYNSCYMTDKATRSFGVFSST